MNDLLVTIILLLNVLKFDRLATLPSPLRFLSLLQLPYFLLPAAELIHKYGRFSGMVFVVRGGGEFPDGFALLALDCVKLLQLGLEFFPSGQLFLMLLFEF